MTPDLESTLSSIRPTAARTPGLDLLLLFGSHARGDSHASSDWDFGYLASPETDTEGLRLRLMELLGTDAVDLVDLAASSGLLRYRAARDGRVICGGQDAFEAFWLESVRFWCDAAPILEAGYDAILKGLPS